MLSLSFCLSPAILLFILSESSLSWTQAVIGDTVGGTAVLVVWGWILNDNFVWRITTVPQMLFERVSKSRSSQMNEWLSSQRKDIAVFIHSKHSIHCVQSNTPTLMTWSSLPYVGIHTDPQVKGIYHCIVPYTTKYAVSLINKIQATERLLSLIFLRSLSLVIIFQLSLCCPLFISWPEAYGLTRPRVSFQNCGIFVLDFLWCEDQF